MYVEILLNKLRILVEEFKQCENRIKREQMQIEDVCNALRRFQSDAMHEVELKLTRQIQGLESDIQKVKMLRTALVKIISAYDSCEDKILSLDEGKQTENSGRFEAVLLHEYLELIQRLDVRFLKTGRE